MSKQKSKESQVNSLRWKPYLLIFLATFLLYGNTLNHGFALDDDVVYRQNSFVQEGFAGIPSILSHGFLFGYNQKNDQSYRPLVLVNFAIEHQVFGNNASAHHFFAVLIYGIACCLLYFLLTLLLPVKLQWLCIWITLLFLFHPIHTEVVANIKGRDDLLHMVFFLLSLIQTIRYLDSNKMSRLYYAMLFLFLACLSKEMAITALVIIPMTVYTFRSIESKRLIRITLALVAPVAAYLLLRKLILETVTFEEQMQGINNTIALANDFGEQLATTFWIFLYYLKLLFWPHPLAWDYSYPFFQIHSLTEPLILFFVFVLIGITSWAIYALVRRKEAIAFSWLFFLASFSIVSNFFILIGSTLGERFLFFPSIGIVLGFALILNKITENLKLTAKRKQRAVIGLFALILLPMAFKTHARNKDWKSNTTLFVSGYKATPNNSRAVSAYATTFREIGESHPNPVIRKQNFEEAIRYYLQSIALYPEVAEVYYNLGVCYTGVQQIDKAIEVYTKAIAVDPNYINAVNNLGVIYFQNKAFAEAESYFKQCLSINANFQRAYANLGAVYHNMGDLQQAKSNYEIALRLNPQDQNTLKNYQILNN